MSTAYVAQYIATWTYSGGLPLPCVSQVTRMRHPRKSTASIGAKFTVNVAVFRMSWMGRLSYFTLKASAAVRTRARAVYTRKYWIVRLMTHCIDVDTGFTLNLSPTSGTFSMGVSSAWSNSAGSARSCAPWAAQASARSARTRIIESPSRWVEKAFTALTGFQAS